MKQLTYDENIQAIAKETSEAYGAHIVPSGCITSAMVTIRRIQGAIGFALCEAGWDADCVEKYLKEQGWLPDDEQAPNAPASPDNQTTTSVRLTAEDTYTAFQKSMSPFVIREFQLSRFGILSLMEQYAAQEVEHKTKRLNDQVDEMIGLLIWLQNRLTAYDKFTIGQKTKNMIEDILTKLNQNDEG